MKAADKQLLLMGQILNFHLAAKERRCRLGKFCLHLGHRLVPQQHDTSGHISIGNDRYHDAGALINTFCR